MKTGCMMATDYRDFKHLSEKMSTGSARISRNSLPRHLVGEDAPGDADVQRTDPAAHGDRDQEIAASPDQRPDAVLLAAQPLCLIHI